MNIFYIPPIILQILNEYQEGKRRLATKLWKRKNPLKEKCE